MRRFSTQQWFRPVAVALVVSGVVAGTYTAAKIAEPTANQSALSASASPANAVQVAAYRSPTCGCCEGWIEHLRTHGFQVTDHVTEDIEAIKQQHNVPGELVSCHTALVNGYVIEGHVPAAAIERFLTEKPDVAGIAVPGMPIGSPGMESGNIKQPFTVFTFTEDGTSQAFQEYSS